MNIWNNIRNKYTTLYYIIVLFMIYLKKSMNCNTKERIPGN